MIKRVVILTLASGLISACSPKLDDLRAYTAQVQQVTQVNIEPYPEFTPQPAFPYAAHQLRSPFVRPKAQNAPVQTKSNTDCLQPDYDRPKVKLESYGLDALSLAGQFVSQGTQYVLFTSNDGKLHKATLGSRIGLFYGTITSISPKSVTIEQLLPDGAGCWQRKETTLTIASSTGDNENV